MATRTTRVMTPAEQAGLPCPRRQAPPCGALDGSAYGRALSSGVAPWQVAAELAALCGDGPDPALD